MTLFTGLGQRSPVEVKALVTGLQMEEPVVGTPYTFLPSPTPQNTFAVPLALEISR